MAMILKNNYYYRFTYILILFFLLVATGCKSSHKKTDPVVVETVRATANLKGMEKKIVEEAQSWIGTPYKYGGHEKGKGSDCSGMVCKVYETITSIKLPRTSLQQAEFCEKLKKKDVRPGDLAFFATGKDPHKISHVGIMIDNNRFIHASTKKGVVISEISTPYYERTFIMFGRVPKSAD